MTYIFCDICDEITQKFAKDMNGLPVNLDVLCRLSFEPVLKSQENTKIVWAAPLGANVFQIFHETDNQTDIWNMLGRKVQLVPNFYSHPHESLLELLLIAV